MNISNFMLTLPVIFKGMVGIFAVTAVVIIIMILLNKLTNRTK